MNTSTSTPAIAHRRREKTIEVSVKNPDQFFNTIDPRLRCSEGTLARCALLGICDRTIVAPIPLASPYRREWRNVLEQPKTLGERLRKARVDRRLTIVQAAYSLGVAYQTVEKWEHNRTLIGAKSRAKVVAFIGHDPDIKRTKPSR